MSKNNPPSHDKMISCRVCGKPIHRSASLAHAYSRHFVQWYNWTRSRIDFFGLSARDHVGGSVQLDDMG